jgi:hypothetical protein
MAPGSSAQYGNMRELPAGRYTLTCADPSLAMLFAVRRSALNVANPEMSQTLNPLSPWNAVILRIGIYGDSVVSMVIP